MNLEPEGLTSDWKNELFLCPEIFDSHIDEVDVDEWPHTFTAECTPATDPDDTGCYAWAEGDPFSPENLRSQPVFPDFMQLVEEASSRSYGT